MFAGTPYDWLSAKCTQEDRGVPIPLTKMDKVAFVEDFLATGVAKEGIPFALFVCDFDDFEVIRRIEPK